MATTKLYDVLILGGGPAGLAAAQALARQLWTAVVFSNGVFRNARARHMHNVLGFDHVAPADFRSKARADIERRYESITFQDDTNITQLAKLDDGRFEARTASGQSWRGRKVIIATGITDIPEAIEGYAAAWGRGIVHCLFCHGFEERGAAHVGVLATGDLASSHGATHMARLAKRLAEKVTVYTHGNRPLADEINAKMATSVTGIRADSRAIAAIHQREKETGVTLAFAAAEGESEEGATAELGFLVHRPKAWLNGDFAAQLGCELEPSGLFKVASPMPETSVKGVFAAGDGATMMGAVPTASFLGTCAAAGVVFQLLEDPF